MTLHSLCYLFPRTLYILEYNRLTIGTGTNTYKMRFCRNLLRRIPPVNHLINILQKGITQVVASYEGAVHELY